MRNVVSAAYTSKHVTLGFERDIKGITDEEIISNCKIVLLSTGTIRFSQDDLRRTKYNRAYGVQNFNAYPVVDPVPKSTSTWALPMENFQLKFTKKRRVLIRLYFV